MKLLPVVTIAVSCGLAIWLALPPAIIVAALIRSLARVIKRKHARPSEAPIPGDSEE
jgi:hypothetical protein